MAYSQTLELVVGDTRPVLSAVIRDRNAAASGSVLDEDNELTWAPLDITGATVSLFIRPVGSSVLQDTLVGTVTDGENGAVAFVFAADTWEAAGTYDGEVQIVFSDGGIQTLQKFIKFKVRDEIG